MMGLLVDSDVVKLDAFLRFERRRELGLPGDHRSDLLAEIDRFAIEEVHLDEAVVRSSPPDALTLDPNNVPPGYCVLFARGRAWMALRQCPQLKSARSALSQRLHIPECEVTVCLPTPAEDDVVCNDSPASQEQT
jgi:hypothetical protein